MKIVHRLVSSLSWLTACGRQTGVRPGKAAEIDATIYDEYVTCAECIKAIQLRRRGLETKGGAK